ncbi:YCR090C [Zygosaccharomyces parabailii]|uniref:BN860_00892g1_1 n=1 Tax=Zygosaccharomyces bailii (strain CLIB 213 / ATCC 58445 / CBS 680 / BCRC 21525 / NBRC 1098 / NCYC 1416 / NRRL Y-2227) TaxID=1333698 RepID=A0A8J2X5V7_ZYGB2|nr:YCR090C [Zygosaccharomyces parabailii]CDF88039.1 BN860_00892g1_1 [Zygosaccharomyces bailii CLIB 213]CDH14438.1 related to DUF866 domain protein [Zygosaccharomyces bailii ISA1307]SJM87346.1 related to UPF0587 protein YCR090C [Zygosaccharomyces bailii]
MLYLVINATLSENIKRIFPRDVEESAAEYTFDLLCTSCREKHESPVVINRFEKHQIPGSKGEASFLMKCRFCGKEISVGLAEFEDSLYNGDERKEVLDKRKIQRKKHDLKNLVGKCVLLAMDCRGCEITGFYSDNLTFVAELISGKNIEFQFEEDEWYDYDDDAGEEVSVTEFSYEIIKGK